MAKKRESSGGVLVVSIPANDAFLPYGWKYLFQKCVNVCGGIACELRSQTTRVANKTLSLLPFLSRYTLHS